MKLRIRCGHMVIQAVHKDIVRRDTQSVGDINKCIETGRTASDFNEANVLARNIDNFSEFFLRKICFRSLILYSFSYAFVIYGHVYLQIHDDSHKP